MSVVLSLLTLLDGTIPDSIVEIHSGSTGNSQERQKQNQHLITIHREITTPQRALSRATMCVKPLHATQSDITSTPNAL